MRGSGAFLLQIKEIGAGIKQGGCEGPNPLQITWNRKIHLQTQQRPENLRSQAVAGDLLGLDWGLRAHVRMPEP
jgi:hypothetical protein